MQPWKKVQELRKAGKPDEALQMAQGLLHQSPNEYQARAQAEWACFDLVKQVVARIQKSVETNERTNHADLDGLYQLLRNYANLGPRVPDMALSNILNQLSKFRQVRRRLQSSRLWHSTRPNSATAGAPSPSDRANSWVPTITKNR